MEVTSSYNIKAVDIYSSKIGYLFKVALADRLSVGRYKFVYMPFGKYSSVLIAEFLFATKSEWNSELMELLQSAIRDDLGPDKGFVVFNTIEAARLHDGAVAAEDKAEFAVRPATPKDLKLFRKIFLGNRDNSSDLRMHSGASVAFRMNQERLFVDFKTDMAMRDRSRSLQVNKSDFQAQRDFIFKLLISFGHGTSIREISNDLRITGEDEQGERVDRQALFVNGKREAATRIIDYDALIIKNGIAASRKINRVARVWTVGSQSRRESLKTTILDKTVISSRRDHLKITKVLRDAYWAKLKARQYPSELLKSLIGANRDRASNLWLHLDQIRMKRLMNRDTKVDRSSARGMRKMDRQQMAIFKEKRWGSRDIVTKADLAIAMSSDISTGSRIIFNKLGVSADDSSGRIQNERTVYVPSQEYRGFRRNDRGLYMPSEIAVADKSGEPKQLYIESVAYRAGRADGRIAHIPTYTTDSSSHLAPRPGHLADEEEFAEHLLFIKQGDLIDQFTGSKEELVKSSELIDFFNLGITNRKLFGEVVGQELWGKVLRERIGYVLEDVIADKGFMADVIDEMIFGERLHDGSSWVELAEMFGITLPELPAFITPDFLTGVRDRMNAIFDAELPVGIRANASNGLIEVHFETSERIEGKAADLGQEIVAFEPPTPAELRIENPLGYFDPNPSFLDEQPAAIKPVDHNAVIGEEKPLGIQEAKPSVIGNEILGQEDPKSAMVDDTVDADLLTKPAQMEVVLEADYDHTRPAAVTVEELMGELTHRVALLETGFIFGSRPDERAAYIADIYFLGVERTARDGAIDDIEWEKFATLALRSAIIEEQMFGTDPVRASELLEDILGRLDVRPSEMLEDGQAEKAPMPSEINLDMLAQKADHYAENINILLGDKELAHAIIDDYIHAQKRISEGILPEAILGKAELRQSLLEQGGLAQGLYYDYQDGDVLESGSDPEDWEGGFGVPEDYDPHDPFNEYYPWAVELNRDELDVDDWQRFDTDHNQRGEWSRDRSKKEFTCIGSSENVSGYIRNDFTHEDYAYEVDFRVDDPQDDDAAGVVFRYVDDHNYYMFMVTGGDADGSLGVMRSMQLFRMIKGTPQLMGPPMSPFTWTQGQWQRLKVSVAGNRIRLWVNGRMQYDFTD